MLVFSVPVSDIDDTQLGEWPAEHSGWRFHVRNSDDLILAGVYSNHWTFGQLLRGILPSQMIATSRYALDATA